MDELGTRKSELERQNQQLLHAYAELDRVLAEYTELYDCAPVGYLTVDADRRIVKANLTCCRMLQRERVVLQGMDFLDLLAKAERAPFLGALDRVYRTVGKVEQETMLCNDTPVLLTAAASDGVRQCRIVLSDLTKQKRAEDALRDSERRFKALVEVTSDWVWEVDAKGMYTYVSPKVYDLLGYGPDEVLGKTPFDFMPAHEAERVLLVFGEIMARREPFRNLRNVNLRKDGKEVVLETSGVPIFDGSGTLCGFRGIDRDITDR